MDDAHGFGVIGNSPDADLPYGYRGNGIVNHLALDFRARPDRSRRRLSKAFSSYAAFVTCENEKFKMMLQNILITLATFPAAPVTRNRVRFSITSANTEQELDQAIAALRAVREALQAKGAAATVSV